MIYFVGDTHGELEAHKLTNKAFADILQKDDFVVVLGDFGLFFHGKSKDDNLLKSLEKLNVQILFIDGNHENFDVLYSLPSEQKFGGEVGVAGRNIFWLKRGEIYEIAGFNILSFGGALSVDRAHRTLNKTYWEAEIPSQAEFENALNNIQNAKQNGKTIDVVLSHTAPSFAINCLHEFTFFKRIEDKTQRYLDSIFELTKPKRWYFGHFHGDKKFTLSGCEFCLCYDTKQFLQKCEKES